MAHARHGHPHIGNNVDDGTAAIFLHPLGIAFTRHQEAACEVGIDHSLPAFGTDILKEGRELAAYYAASDVFVFPSKTDTFGLVLLEALACGVPVAAYPVTGPLDVIGTAPVGVLDTDLGRAARAALDIDRKACRAFALDFSWDRSSRQFRDNLVSARGGGRTRAEAAD